MKHFWVATVLFFMLYIFFLRNLTVLLLAGESDDSQPQVCIAAYQKRFRGKVSSFVTMCYVMILSDCIGYTSQCVPWVHRVASIS